jgi:hypothetical protein
MLKSQSQLPSTHSSGASTISLMTIFLLGGAILGALGFATESDAAPENAEGQVTEDRDLESWVPSIAFFGGVQEQDSRGTIVPGDVMGPQCTPVISECSSTTEIQPESDGDETLRAVRLGLSAELMTPRFWSGFGKPRIFAHIDPIYAVGFDRTVTGVGSPGEMVEGDVPPSVTRSEEALWSGQGTRIKAEISPFELGAGIGAAFTFDVFDRRVRIKPSFEYLRERLSVIGQVNRVVQVVQRPVPGRPGDFRQIALRATERKTYHAIGPALEISTDGDRLGPFILSPFISGRAYRFLGDLDVDLSDTNEYGETAEWHFRRDEWEWDVRAGLRLLWLPK